MVATTNQGLILPDGPDNANVPLSFTDFVTTAGSGMENRLVQRYVSAADRTARNPAPNTGELSFLSDTAAYEWYNGSAWIALSKGFVGDSTRIVSSAGFTTTELITDTITFTSLGTAVRYKFSIWGDVQSTVANDICGLKIRWAVGGALTSAGTLIDSAEFTIPVVTRQFLFARSKSLTGIPAGTATIGLGMLRNSGTGTLTSIGAAGQQIYSLLEII